MLNNIYKFPRYWYHVSSDLEEDIENLIPREEGELRCPSEPLVKRICVAPTIEQCFTAIPYAKYKLYNIYRTFRRVKANKPTGVFDSKVTDEGWITNPTTFLKIGKISFKNIKKKIKDNIISESASSGSFLCAKEVLRWWKKIELSKYIIYHEN